MFFAKSYKEIKKIKNTDTVNSKKKKTMDKQTTQLLAEQLVKTLQLNQISVTTVLEEVQK